MSQTYPEPITAAMVTPAYVPDIQYGDGAAYQGADATNDGEMGTLSVAYNADPEYEATDLGYAPKTQAVKAAALGTTIAPDVTKSYAGERGTIEPFQPYPTAEPEPEPEPEP